MVGNVDMPPEKVEGVWEDEVRKKKKKERT